MPRAGSSSPPPTSGSPEPMSIGEVATPPVAVLPDPATVFERRSRRFAALAVGHELGAYLEFLSRLAHAQHTVQAGLAAVRLPSSEQLATSRANTMPPIAFGTVEIDETCDATLLAIVAALAGAETLNAATRDALARVRDADAAGRKDMMTAVLLDAVPEDRIADHVLAAAALQVHFARVAALLDVATLQPIADHACPACGSGPTASAIVGWEGAHGTRFCTCSLCATQWHVVRSRCLMCASEKGVAYRSIEGKPDTVSGETCDDCRSYVKIVHQHKDPALDPTADDVATLALDMLLAREDWKRAGVNPFLVGY